MAAVNSVRLPLNGSGMAPTRVLMCSASMGAEGFTLKLRDPEMLTDMVVNKTVTKFIEASSVAASVNGTSNKTITTIVQHQQTTSPSLCTTSIKKSSRPKTASPTRHGPQQCQVCSKVFGNASALAKHKLTHSDERKYVCTMCSKAFKRQDHLNGHMLTHRHKKPYECKADGCGKSYCDARSLRRHTENHHGSLIISTNPSTTSNSSSMQGSSNSSPNNSNNSNNSSNSNASNNSNSSNPSASIGPPANLSLSPATASGDASSPHGATCIQYQTNADNTITAITSKASSPSSSPAGAGNEGLTRQQLDLISQIMQQTKQANAGIINGHKNAQRPRTWNMQTQLQQNQSKVSNNNTGEQHQHHNQASNGSSNAQQQTGGPKLDQKPVECNLCHRKFKNIPALNGHMRLHGGYFKKDSDTKKCDKKESTGPPLQTASVGVRALIEEKIISKRSKDLKLSMGSFVVPTAPGRRLTDTEAFLNAKLNSATGNTITIVTSAGNNHGLTKQPVVHQVIQQKAQINSLPDNKDATLIELLKRGTKVAVKRACSDPGQLGTQTKIMVPTLTNSSPPTPTTPFPLSLSVPNGNSSPLSLTISQASSGSSDVFTLFGDNDVYSATDTAMLLQAVDSIQLLQDTSTSDQLDDIVALSDYSLNNNSSSEDNISLSHNFTPSQQLQAVLDSPLPDSLAEFSALHSKDYVLYGCSSTESPTTQSSNSPMPSPLAYPTPPASHEAVAQASPFLDDSHHFSDGSTFFNDDKKNITLFMDDNSQFYKDSKEGIKLSENERILQLKNELFNDSKAVLEESSFFRSNKSILDEHDLFKNDSSFLSNDSKAFIGDNCAKLQDFNQNLDFLDEAHDASSPLSAAFFSATLSSAEEVKEALDEVLPNEDDGSALDLYFLPMSQYQSQMMMPNSDDPLLSSSPKDFVNHRQNPQMQQQTNNNMQQTAQPPIQTIKYDFDSFCPPNSKKIKTEIKTEIKIEDANDDDDDQNTIPLTVQTEQLYHKDNFDSVFLSPSSISSSNSSPKLQNALLSSTKKRANDGSLRKYENFKSKMKKIPQLHFTPRPILNPERSGAGLYSVIQKSLDYIIPDIDTIELFEKPRVNIGSDYQAHIPENNVHYRQIFDDYDNLQWDPSVIENDQHLDRFVDLAKSSAVPLGTHSEEVALKTLLECQGEVHVAILKLLQTHDESIHKRWSQQEMEYFLRGLEHYGKDFFRISRDLPKKSTGDCIQLYYFWKKLCNEYKTTHLPQSAVPNSYLEFPISNSVPTSANHNNSNHNPETRPHVCEIPDCSASFSSRAALHGHIRIHCIGRSVSALNNGNLTNNNTQPGTNIKDDFPCKVCGKVFNKVKSRSAHMKSHRPQEPEQSSM